MPRGVHRRTTGLGPGGRLDRRPCRSRGGATLRPRPGGRRPLARPPADRLDGSGAGRPAGGRRAPPVRARPLAVPVARAERRSPGPHSPSGDRTGGPGGAGPVGADVRRSSGRPWRWWAGGRTGLEPAVCRPRDRLRGDRPLAGRRRRRRLSGPGGLGHRPVRRRPGGGGRQPRVRWPTPMAPPPAGSAWPTGSWFDALPSELAGRVDLMVSNPPYVAESEYSRLEPVGPRLGAPRRAGGLQRVRAVSGGCAPSRRSSPVRGAGCATPDAWSSRSPPPRRRHRWRRPAGPVSARSPPTLTWPGGNGCWWPGGDHERHSPASGSGGDVPGGRGAAGRIGRRPPDRHRLRAGGRPRRDPTPWSGSSPSRNGLRTSPSPYWSVRGRRSWPSPGDWTGSPGTWPGGTGPDR